MPSSAESIEKTLKEAIPVLHLEVRDESSGCGEKFAVLIVSEAFDKKITLARHRLVNSILKDEIAQMHAFSQVTLTPQQYEEKKAKGEI